MEIFAYFLNEPLCLRLERNDNLVVPRPFPTGRGSIGKGGPINVVHVIFIIGTYHDFLLITSASVRAEVFTKN